MPKTAAKPRGSKLAIVGLVVLASVLAMIPPEYALPLMLLIGAVLLTWTLKYPLLYSAIFLIPFVGITFNFNDYSLLRSLPFLGSWDAPIGDFVALTVTIVFGMYMMHYEREKHIYHHLKDHLPALKWYGPFLIVAALTIFRAPREMQGISLQYFIRFVLFSYIAYVAMPYWMIKTKDQLRKIIHVFSWSGVVVAGLGAASLLVNEPFWGIWRRVSPFAIGNVAPVGLNHNLLAEFLIIVIPVTLYVAAHTHERYKKWYAAAAIFMTIVVLLTFGRTAWITLAVQGFAAWWFLRPKKFTHMLLRAWPALIVAAILTMYMGLFSTSDFVQLSTNSRLDLTKFALIQAQETPWLGHGIGTFMPTLGNSGAFNLEYGGPIEAHGFGQKILFETGIIGLALFLMFFIYLLLSLASAWNESHHSDYKNLVLAVYISLLGALVFQVFNTSYFNAKLWFPVGLALVVLMGKWKFKSKV